jgi:hypothetical protein
MKIEPLEQDGLTIHMKTQGDDAFCHCPLEDDYLDIESQFLGTRTMNVKLITCNSLSFRVPVIP